MKTDFSKLKRAKQPMPSWVLEALQERGLLSSYQARPAYQQNDYIAWVTRAKLPATQAKRLAQMLEELQAGGVYMKMRHAASARC